MDPEERARRREERRRKQQEESDAAETNGPTDRLSNDTGEEEEDDSERLKEQEAQRLQEEKEKLKKEKERKRNAEIERQRQEDIQRAAEGQSNDAPQKSKKKSLFGGVSKGRKKEILAMMLKKARGDLQIEEQEAAEEKAKFIGDNVKESNVDSCSLAQLRQICEELHSQLENAEGTKFDLEIKVKRRDLQISSLKVKANETRGRFAMPSLKAVTKTDPSKSRVDRKDFRSDLKKAEPTADN